MEIRLKREHFVRTSTLKGFHNQSARRWEVCEDYEIEPVPPGEWFRETPYGREFLGSTRIVSKYSPSRTDKWRNYDPVNDHPDLFLTFARLHETAFLEDSILNWVRRYGFLGLNNKIEGRYLYFEPEYTEAITKEAQLASAILLGYETVLSEDSDAAKQIIFDRFPTFFTLDWMTPGGIVLGPGERELYSIGRNDTIEVVEQHYDGDYLWYLLESCAYTVQEMVSAFCWPSLSVEKKPRAPVRATASWGARNLLGAMYLQMYRLMAAGEEVTTCRYCGKVIPLKPEKTGERKQRQDKLYCDDACRQRYHYHNRVKPRRQKESGN